MAKTLGKQFEDVFKETINKTDLDLDRLHDPQGGQFGISNICDFEGYLYPYRFYFECKTVKEGRFPFSNLTETQFNGLLQKSKIYGTRAGVVVWFYERDFTTFINISDIYHEFVNGRKSINVNDLISGKVPNTQLTGKKKVKFFDYNGVKFVKALLVGLDRES